MSQPFKYAGLLDPSVLEAIRANAKRFAEDPANSYCVSTEMFSRMLDEGYIQKDGTPTEKGRDRLFLFSPVVVGRLPVFAEGKP